MADRWYYAHDDSRAGPYSASQMRERAADGRIIPTDTVWKDGTERGVPARKVKNLFADVPGAVTVPGPALPRPQPVTRVALGTAPPGLPESPAPPTLVAPVIDPPASAAAVGVVSPAPPVKAVKLRKATRASGAVIVGQDGATVRYRKKCGVCGHEDASCARMPIRNGVTREGFYCPTCKKRRPVEIHGSVK